MDIVLEQRNPELFSADLKRVISYIRLKEKTQPVGSFKYKIFEYPNDIDIFVGTYVGCVLVALLKLGADCVAPAFNGVFPDCILTCCGVKSLFLLSLYADESTPGNNVGLLALI